MKGLFTVVALLFFFTACKESGVVLSKPTTFVKYYSDGNQDQAIDILETSDHGFLILANADSVVGGINLGGINITKTDLSGNVTGKKYFRNDTCQLQASNFVLIKDNSGNEGYVIVGTVKGTSWARLFVLRIKINTNNDGGFTVSDSISYSIKPLNGQARYVIGKGVAQSSNAPNDIFLLGEVVLSDLVTHAPTTPDGKGGDMYFTQVKGTTLDTVFTRVYGGGITDLASRLYLDYTQNYAYWGGTRVDDFIHMRLVKSGFDSQEAIGDFPYPVGDNTGYTGNDFCIYGYGFTLIGSHASSPQEIAVARVGSGGDMIGSVTNFNRKITIGNQSVVVPVAGNSICSTQDGGLLLLGTSSKDALGGTDTDYYLIKVDGTLQKQWEIAHGGKYPDVGVRVLQSTDGGYVVLGTTTLANVKTVVLLKTDSQGNIE